MEGVSGRGVGLRVKICGITTAAQGAAIADYGATALGFICVPQTPRYVTPDTIATIVAQLPINPATGKPICDRIGVFVNATLTEICETAAVSGLNGVQLHGDESPAFCHELRTKLPGIELIKAFRIRSLDALATTQSYGECIDTLLLDAYHPNQIGGTGKTLDWQALQRFRPARPWFLAGGLTPANIRTALSQLHPNGIDLSSGVERSPGDKDLDKVAHLFMQLRYSMTDHSRDRHLD